MICISWNNNKKKGYICIYIYVYIYNLASDLAINLSSNGFGEVTIFLKKNKFTLINNYFHLKEFVLYEFF